MNFNIKDISKKLEKIPDHITPSERLLLVANFFPRGVVFTTGFGMEDQMITHLIATQGLPFRIVTLDTGRFFPETYELWQRTEEKYGLRIQAFYPDKDALGALVADQGINGFYYARKMREACCAVRKVEPLSRALQGAQAWITGLRRDQSPSRKKLDFIQHDEAGVLLKINPLYALGRDEISAFTLTHDVPVSTLHAAGFLSIGCAPCTRAVQPGENERAGRWWWETEGPKECGLHTGTLNTPPCNRFTAPHASSLKHFKVP